MAFIALEKLHCLHDGYRRVFRIGAGEWVLLQEDGKLYCFANQCPHLSAPLHQASVHNHVLRCPLHGIEFDLRSGKPLVAESCKNSLRFLPLVYDNNRVGVDVGS
jgi:nitrite reductase/ring-hydroxylating ferredoxin subunit